MFKKLKMSVVSVLLSVLVIGTAEPVKAADGSSYQTQMRGLSASELTADMGAGWNLGNSLESENNETYWGNPQTTKAMIDKIAAKGFKTLRIPVRWDDNYTDSSSYTIKSDYMDRVEEVVNYGLADGMYVIINVHHNDLQTMVSTDSNVQKRVKNELSAIWKQVGKRFKNYGDKLIFETINEPRAGEDWNGNTSYYDCVNKYNEASRAAIRATGGNNGSRLIMMPAYCASPDTPKINGWKNLGNDPMIAVSIHAYLPFDFAFEGGGHSNWTDSDYQSLDSVFNQLDSAFISKGIPVVIGEFGATNKGNTADREKYAEIYATFAKKYDIPCIWWDNNCFGYGAENFGIFDRSSLSFTYEGIADALVNVY
ncbi:glycoside hydrolase family 5 protein [Clostridium sp. Marseille-P2415]|uniref:glycoside hydrolase family 5 protein n=1 Tax=Clostridium sp. Marseille-P2415 TaxID=1805471 RepID=UPI0009886880|nr:glycoside hydrolase family 5 protein [Clostridium sp. Marseille-P2415]